MKESLEKELEYIKETAQDNADFLHEIADEQNYFIQDYLSERKELKELDPIYSLPLWMRILIKFFFFLIFAFGAFAVCCGVLLVIMPPAVLPDGIVLIVCGSFLIWFSGKRRKR